jgi:hypothetical protein
MKWDYITKQATAIKPSWSNKDRVLFHYFNPNGVAAEKFKLDRQISDLVDQGKCKSGAVYAYGTLNTYYIDELRKLIDSKRVSQFDSWYYAEQLRVENEKARKFIAEHAA